MSVFTRQATVQLIGVPRYLRLNVLIREDAKDFTNYRWRYVDVNGQRFLLGHFKTCSTDLSDQGLDPGHKLLKDK